MLELNRLNLDFGNFKLKNINLKVREGKTLCILGKSGGGKTLLLETIIGRHKVDRGDIFLAGKSIRDSKPEDRNIAMVYQNYNLFPFLTAYENIEFPLRFKRSTPIDKEKIFELMEELGIFNLRNRGIKNLSGGERQRIALARALVLNPDLLILDEPLGALDMFTKESAAMLIAYIAKTRKLSMVYVTHDIDEAKYFADDLVILSEGKVKNKFTIEDFNELTREEILYEYL